MMEVRLFHRDYAAFIRTFFVHVEGSTEVKALYWSCKELMCKEPDIRKKKVHLLLN